MMRDYCGIRGNYGFEGTPYNTGDGVRMAIEVGADLWHMHSYEGSGQMGGLGYVTPRRRADQIGHDSALHGRRESKLVHGRREKRLPVPA